MLMLCVMVLLNTTILEAQTGQTRQATQVIKNEYTLLTKALAALQEGELYWVRFYLEHWKKKQGEQNSLKQSNTTFKLSMQVAMLKLEGLLFLKNAKYGKALEFFEQAMQKIPQAGLAYFIGSYFNDQKNFDKAAHYFQVAAKLSSKENIAPSNNFTEIKQKQAVRSIFSNSYLKKAGHKKEDANAVAVTLDKLSVSLVPVFCPQRVGEILEKFNHDWISYSRNPKTLVLFWDLFNQPLAPRYSVLAAYQSYVYRESVSRNAQLPLLQKLSATLSDDSSYLRKLSTSPENVKAHEKCIFQLQQVQQKSEREVRAGAGQIMRKQYAFINVKLEQARYNALRVLRDFQSSRDYTKYLWRHKKYLAALHSARLALKYLSNDLQTYQVKKGKKSRIVDLQQILNLLQKVYTALHREKDVYFLKKINKIIIKYATVLPKSPNSKDWIGLTIMQCKNNLHNREALMFLIGSKNYSPIKDMHLYSKKLNEYDAKHDFNELRSGFASIYNFK